MTDDTLAKAREEAAAIIAVAKAEAEEILNAARVEKVEAVRIAGLAEGAIRDAQRIAAKIVERAEATLEFAREISRDLQANHDGLPKE